MVQSPPKVNGPEYKQIGALSTTKRSSPPVKGDRRIMFDQDTKENDGPTTEQHFNRLFARGNSLFNKNNLYGSIEKYNKLINKFNALEDKKEELIPIAAKAYVMRGNCLIKLDQIEMGRNSQDIGIKLFRDAVILTLLV